MKLSASRFAIMVATLATGLQPAVGTEWQIDKHSTSHTRSHCWVNNQESCWVTYTDTGIAYKGYFGSKQAASAACSSVLDGGVCGYASGEPGPPLMSGGWLVTCSGGVNQYGLCVSTLRRHAAAYFPTVVVEQDVERPQDCRTSVRQFGNPIDGLTGEKRELIGLLRWSSGAPAPQLHYRSGRFARQVGTPALPGNNLPGSPVAAGSVGSDIPNAAGHQPFGPLWGHSMDSRVTMTGNVPRLSHMPGGGDLSFRGSTDGSLMLPPSDQADRLQFRGGAGGASWLHRDPRLMRTNYFSTSGMLIHAVNADGTGRQWLTYSDSATPLTQAAGPERLLSVRDAQGRLVRVGYLRDGSGLATDLIGELADDQGSRTGFDYDSAGRLTAVRWPDGSAQRFGYSTTLPWALTTRHDEAGVAVGNWTWNHSTGLVNSTAGADGVERHVLQFGQAPFVSVIETLEGPILRRRYRWQAGSASEVAQPNGTRVTLVPATVDGHLQLALRSQPAGAGCNASVQSSVLDANGNAVVRDNFDNSRSCHAYDMARNLELVRIEGLDRSASCADLLPDGATLPPGARKITTRWHPVWPLPEVTASPGRIEHLIYNARPDPLANNTTLICMPDVGYDEGFPDIAPAALCRRVQRATIDANGGQGLQALADPDVPTRDERWTHNRLGWPLSHDGPRTDLADITTYAYHPTSTANATAGDLLSVRNAAGQVTTFTRYNRTGQVLEQQDANGVPTSFAYNLRQRPIQVTQAGQRTQLDYAPNGLLTKVTLPDASTLSFGYDTAQRLVSISDGSGSRIRYTLDTSGQRISEERQDAQGTLTRRLTRIFDALGRVQEQVGRP